MTQIAPRMRYAPTSEQEVIVLFALLLPDLPFRLELDEVHTGFPDCLAWRVNEDGRETAANAQEAPHVGRGRWPSHFRQGRQDPVLDIRSSARGRLALHTLRRLRGRHDLALSVPGPSC